MATRPHPSLTSQEYLALERKASFRSEFYEGQAFAMAGASEGHVLIVLNVASEVRARLRETPCRVYANDMRVKVAATGLYTYPDVIGLCDPPSFEDDRRDTLLNPALVVEVLSPSTEAYDRGRKAEHYRRIPSLREYLLVAQDAVHVELYRREDQDRWLLAEANGLDGVLHLASVGCDLSLRDVYDKVVFPRGIPLRPEVSGR
jgi:Uma2 family endonuclease